MDSNFSALSGHSNRITVLKRARPKAFRATNHSKIGDTDPEHSLFPDTYKMLLLRAGPRRPVNATTQILQPQVVTAIGSRF